MKIINQLLGKSKQRSIDPEAIEALNYRNLTIGETTEILTRISEGKRISMPDGCMELLDGLFPLRLPCDFLPGIIGKDADFIASLESSQYEKILTKAEAFNPQLVHLLQRVNIELGKQLSEPIAKGN